MSALGWSRLCVLAGTAGLGAAALAARVSESPAGAFHADGIERGIARIVCRSELRNVVHESRVFVIDTRGAATRHDLLLTAAHGLPRSVARIARDCRVRGVHGPPAVIIDAWKPEASSLDDDWALLVTSRPLKGAVGRLRAAALTPELLAGLIAGRAPIEMLLYSDRSDVGACRLLGDEWVADTERDQGLFAHSCRTRPGLSGSPILMRLDGEPVVVGFSLGRKMRPPRLEGPLFYGIGRVIDEDIASAINDAAARIESMGEPQVVGR